MTYAERRVELRRKLRRAQAGALIRAKAAAGEHPFFQKYITEAQAGDFNSLIKAFQSSENHTRNLRSNLGVAVLADRIEAWMDGQTEEGKHPDSPNPQEWVSLAKTGKIAYAKTAEQLKEKNLTFEPEETRSYFNCDIMLFERIMRGQIRQGEMSLGRYLEWLPQLASLMGEVEIKIKGTAELISGAEITKAYRANKLGSCMYSEREYNGARYVSVYEKSETAHMLVIKEGDLPIARALLWACIDHQGNPAVLLDRIYPGDSVGAMAEKIREKARELGMTHEYNRQQPPALITRVQYNEGMPYFDTFSSIIGRKEENLYLCTGRIKTPQLQHPDGNKGQMQQIRQKNICLQMGAEEQISGFIAEAAIAPIENAIKNSLEQFKERIKTLDEIKKNPQKEKAPQGTRGSYLKLPEVETGDEA